MPAFNGTGPAGMGPMTGRGMGYCVLPLSNPGVNRGFGYTGIYGASMPMNYPNTPLIPYRMPLYGMGFGRGLFGFGRGGGLGRGRGRGRRFF